jgi:hypothetical protein
MTIETMVGFGLIGLLLLLVPQAPTIDLSPLNDHGRRSS